MSALDDVYKTILMPFEGLTYKEKGSKFIGFAFPISSEDEVKEIIIEIKKKHYAARHWSYAWQLGVDEISYRVNDDGEPHNSAGMPIYGQIQSFGVTNILIVVVRYYGGVKLGVGGLISAYKTAAQNVLEQAEIVDKLLQNTIELRVSYENLNKVLRFIKEHQLNITHQVMNFDCELHVNIPKSMLAHYHEKFLELHYLKSFKIR
ncbi:MAG: YigZ family protein [Bacteroidetes bacterium]|nr:YigZ family protein [Bacteroidota bacterium]